MVGELTALGGQNASDLPNWFTPIGDLSFTLSLVVNAIFTCLLVFKIAKTSLAEHALSPRQKREFRPLISMLIESGIVLFVVQLLWIIFFSIESNVFYLIGGPTSMIYVREN